MTPRIVEIPNKLKIGTKEGLTFIGGPCVIENENIVMSIAEKLTAITDDLNLGFIFKASFDKANRSSIYSFRGPGLKEGLKILERVKKQFGVPILTDVHEPWQCEMVAEVADVLQIPAYLCRQTDLLAAAAKTGKVVNVKKGQFLAPWDMKNVVRKIEEVGNNNILLTERGATFGYNNLVVDMRSLIEMRKLGYPVVFDATHSVQRPGGKGDSTDGDREYIFPLIRGAVAVGIEAIFAEVHIDPDSALCDGPNMIKLSDLKGILKQSKDIHDLVRESVDTIPEDVPVQPEDTVKVECYEIKSLEHRIAACKAVICDVDGVLTDGKMIYSEKGDEIKNFNVRDGIAARLLQKDGFKLGILSSGISEAIVQKRGQMLDFDIIDVGNSPKRERFLGIVKQFGLEPHEVIYLCDDINDAEVISTGCLAVCPHDAHLSIRREADWVLNTRGGHGCLREVADRILGLK